MIRSLRHITLTTGHVRDSLPGEVSENALDILQQILYGPDSQIPGISSTIPGVSTPERRYQLLIQWRTTRCLMGSVWGQGSRVIDGERVWLATEKIVTIGVAGHSRCGSRLWRLLHRWPTLPLTTDPERCPPEPWVAARLEEGLARNPEAAHWIGDFERCLAWAFLSR